MSGWRIQVRIVEGRRRAHVVKAAVYIRPRILSPFFDVATFTSEEKATEYVKNVKRALEDQ